MVPGEVEIVTASRFVLCRFLGVAHARDQATQAHADGNGGYVQTRRNLGGGFFQDESIPEERQRVLVETVEAELEEPLRRHQALRIAFEQRRRIVLQALLEGLGSSLAAASMERHVPRDRAAPAHEALSIGRAMVVREDDDGRVLDDVVGVIGGRRQVGARLDGWLVRS